MYSKAAAGVVYSLQDRSAPTPETDPAVAPGEPTNPPRSRVSGGGGERDIHHTHDPRTKS